MQCETKYISTRILRVSLNNRTGILIYVRTRIFVIVVIFEYISNYRVMWKEKMRAQFIY